MNTPNNLGWTSNLYILPFDHRSGLFKEFGWTEPITPDEITIVKNDRALMFDAIKSAIAMGIPKDTAPIFMDDVFGKEVLIQAKSEGFLTVLTTEKSGSDFYDFQHGDSFRESINEIKPTFVKALVRYNPQGNAEINKKSLVNLKTLSDFAHENGYKFLIEPLVAPTDDQLERVGLDHGRYDRELRPKLCVEMMQELQMFGIEPDIWKVEGFFQASDYEMVVNQARSGQGRNDVSVISLGRNETDEVVTTWLTEGAKVPGVIGFAVGRTIFLDSLLQFQEGTLTRDQAIDAIAKRFFHFYQIFTGTH